jgi:hypothetical protein
MAARFSSSTERFINEGLGEALSLPEDPGMAIKLSLCFYNASDCTGYTFIGRHTISAGFYVQAHG